MPHLPDEIWLQIFVYIPPQDLWLRFRNVDHRLRRCVEDEITKSALSHFTVGVHFSLGSGTYHRWYDIRGNVTFSFKHLNKVNQQYALFGSPLVHPDSCHKLAMERWKHMCARGVGERQEWQVQHGYEEPVRIVRLPRVVMSDDEGLWCDWREMLTAYYHTPAPRRTTGIVDVAGYLRP